MNLREKLEMLPPDSLVPAGWVLDQLQEPEPEEEKLLRVEDLAEKFDRTPGTVRTWCREGRLEGAFRVRGREWRIPASAVEVFQKEQMTDDGRVEPLGRGPEADLGAWRKERE